MSLGYEKFLASIGLTQAQMDHEAKYAVYRPAYHAEEKLTRLGGSHIHGTGVFSKSTIHRGCFIAPGLIDGTWSRTGRFLNHSDMPNLVLRGARKFNYFEALEKIYPDEELTVDYNQVRNILCPELEATCVTAGVNANL